MNDKEKKSIEKIEKQILIGECEKAIGVPIYISDLKTILNLLEKQKAKIEELDKSLKLHTKLEYQYKNDYLNVIEDLKKKDKQIDLMAEEIAFNYDINSYADVITIKKQLKEKYEKKAEEEK